MISSCKKKEEAEPEAEISIIGQSFNGGVVFYVDGTGQHGLVAAPSDQSTAVMWTGDTVKTAVTEYAVGVGQQNTTLIVGLKGAGNYAAWICDQLVLNGYSDWYLPSRAELKLLYEQRSLVGGFSNDYYWCSTEFDDTKAWNIYFPYGPQYYANKTSLACVRAVRSF
ncbi:MAG: DUF1566 domain-containing protein [Bacteroidota bacterium]